jgi:hypothetical protein
MKTVSRSLFVAALAIIAAVPAQATVFKGDLFFTRFSGGVNVSTIPFTYDDDNGGPTKLFSLGSEVGIAATNGADGIIFSPNGNLLIGGQCSGLVHEVTKAGAVVGSSSAQGCSFHLTLDAGGEKVWTSSFGGDIVEVPLPIDGTAGTLHDVTGDDGGLTQIAFNGDASKAFYVNGQPNGGGNVGIIDLSTFVTTRIHTGVTAAHGLIYDPFTDLMTLFGAGQVGTLSAADGLGLKTGSIAAITGVCDFDQGAVDGKGHALVAGCGGITLIDYRVSGDITAPDFAATIFGFSNIDDVAPLVGLGAPPTGASEPATLGIVGLGLLAAAWARRSRS